MFNFDSKIQANYGACTNDFCPRSSSKTKSDLSWLSAITWRQPMRPSLNITRIALTLAN